MKTIKPTSDILIAGQHCPANEAVKVSDADAALLINSGQAVSAADVQSEATAGADVPVVASATGGLKTIIPTSDILIDGVHCPEGEEVETDFETAGELIQAGQAVLAPNDDQPEVEAAAADKGGEKAAKRRKAVKPAAAPDA